MTLEKGSRGNSGFLHQPKMQEIKTHRVVRNQSFLGIKIDPENWMGQLPDPLPDMPLIHISIPGSHNSFTYSISSDKGVSPDSPEYVQTLGKWCGPFTSRLIFNWSQGQRVDVLHQLKAGVRYYDVRLVLNEGEMVIAHGLFGGRIQGFLEQINTFLETHRKEVVILDFQRFYEFTPMHHENLLSLLIHVFGTKICQRRRRMKENTLQNLWDYNHQVIIIYRYKVESFNDIFWPSRTWVTPWPNKIKIGDLLEYLNQGLRNRKAEFGFVTQGVLTPTPKYVGTHVFGSLRGLAFRSNKKIISWLESKTNGAHGINVVICDFVENFNFCEKVILLNYKAFEDENSEVLGSSIESQDIDIMI